MKDTANNRTEFRTCVQAMFACLGGEVTDAGMLGYWIALEDLTLEQIQQACYQAMRSSKFIPKPSELREMVLGKPDDHAMMAWSDTLKAIPIGPYKHIDFSDKLINATVRNLGGWPTFLSRLTDSQAEKWVRIEFLKCYSQLASSGVTGEMCEPLPGLSQAEFFNGEITKPVPRRIDCSQSKAPRISRGGQKLLQDATA